jgi:hypothetical protein
MTNGPVSIDLTNADSAPEQRGFVAVLDINRAELASLVTGHFENPNKLVSLSLGPPEDHATMVTELERAVYPMLAKDRRQGIFYHKYYLPSDPEHPDDAETRQKMIFGAVTADDKHAPVLLYIVEKLNLTGEFEPVSAAALSVSPHTLQALMPTLPKTITPERVVDESEDSVELLPMPVHSEKMPVRTQSQRKFDAAVAMLRKLGKELLSPGPDNRPF